MIERVRKLIKEQDMIVSGDVVVAGVSGGADSVCMLTVLLALSAELGFTTVAVHVHHGLRGAEADRDQSFVEALCKRLHISCRVFSVDVKKEAKERRLSEEETGRLLRYAAFEETGKAYEKIGKNVKLAVAHHMDDSAETILMNLFRGSGLSGLSGIAAVRGQVIRPLITCSRQEIEAYLKMHRISYCQDETNEQLFYTRNRIRNVVLPYVEQEINPGAVKNILRAGHMISQAGEYLVEESKKFFCVHGGEEGERFWISVKPLGEQKEILQSYVIRHMILAAAQQSKDISAVHIQEVCGLLKKESGRRLKLPHGLLAGREHGIIYVEKKKEPQGEACFAGQLRMAIFSYGKDAEIPKNQYTKWFDYDRIKGTLSVRNRQPGDYITLTGGGKKTVKSYMINEKIPLSQRSGIPLVADGSHILWIVGYRISEAYKVTDNTKTILQIEYDGGNGRGRQN